MMGTIAKVIVTSATAISGAVTSTIIGCLLLAGPERVGVTGRVTDSSGNPIQGVEVRAFPRAVSRPWTDNDIRPRDGTVFRAVSSQDGRYQLDGLVAGGMADVQDYWWGFEPRCTYDIVATVHGYAPQKVRVPTITKAPVRNLTLFTNFVNSVLYIVGTTDNMGEPRTVPLPASRGSIISGIDFVLEKEATVSGRVVDTRGRGVARRYVQMVFKDEQDKGYLAKQKILPGQSETDDAGRFRFDDVPPGVYLFEIEVYPGHDSSVTQRPKNRPLSVDAGDTITDMDLIVEAPEDRAPGASLRHPSRSDVQRKDRRVSND